MRILPLFLKNFKNRHKFGFYVAIVSCVLLLTGGIAWKSRSSHNKSNSKTYKVVKKDMSQSLELSGKVFPETTMVITAQQSGRIVALKVKEGQKVEEKDLLFTMQLEASGQTELMDMRARVKSLEQDLVSNAKIVKNKNLVKDLIGVDQVARDESDLEKMKIELALARDRLQVVESNLGLDNKIKTKAKASKADGSGIVYVRSPVAGIVTLIDKRPGDYVSGGSGFGGGSEIGASNDRMVMVVADMNHLQVRTKVMEADLHSIKQGLAVTVKLDAYADASYAGTVQQIGGQGRTDAKADYTYFDVYINIDQKDARLLPGMNATVNLIFDNQVNALTLSLSSVLILPTHSYVRLEDQSNSDGYRFERVVTGSVNANDVQILSGLKEGDEVMEIDFSSPKIFEIESELDPAKKKASKT